MSLSPLLLPGTSQAKSTLPYHVDDSNSTYHVFICQCALSDDYRVMWD